MQLQIGSMVCSTQQAYTQFSNKQNNNEVIWFLLQRTKWEQNSNFATAFFYVKAELSWNLAAIKINTILCDHGCCICIKLSRAAHWCYIYVYKNITHLAELFTSQCQSYLLTCYNLCGGFNYLKVILTI